MMRGGEGRARAVALIGWCLYGISWVTPNADGSRFGAGAFRDACRYGVQFLAHPHPLWARALGLALLLGWLANFTIFLRLPPPGRWVALVLPWLPFAAAWFPQVPVMVSSQALSQLYFYPWALGITLIHVARLLPASHRGRLQGAA